LVGLAFDSVISRTICRITDVKEKMDELRIACEGADEQIRNLIQEARLESARICQVCGNQGTLRIIGGLAATLCNADAESLSRPRKAVRIDHR
jgi:hypothetical protein